MLLTGPNETHIVDFMAELNSAFEMSNLGLLHHYLGTFSLCKLMEVLLCAKQSILRHYCNVLALKTVSILLLLWREVYN